jgi:hypothetical protein
MSMFNGNGLKRRSGFRPERKNFIFLCEGEVTEPQYFNALKTVYQRVNIYPVKKVGHPGSILDRAKKILDRDQRDSVVRKVPLQKGDEIWAVFDEDGRPDIHDHIAQCKSANVSVAFSNPCFEVWLILHHKDYDRPCNASDAQTELSSIHPEYDPAAGKTLEFKKLMASIEVAENRAKAQLDRLKERGQPLGRPSTNVGDLTRAIRASHSQGA